MNLFSEYSSQIGYCNDARENRHARDWSGESAEDLLYAGPGVLAEKPGHGQHPGLGEHEPQGQSVGPVEGPTLLVLPAAQVALGGQQAEEKDGGVEEHDDEAGQADVKGGMHPLARHVQTQVLALDQVQNGHLWAKAGKINLCFPDRHFTLFRFLNRHDFYSSSFIHGRQYQHASNIPTVYRSIQCI